MVFDLFLLLFFEFDREGKHFKRDIDIIYCKHHQQNAVK